MNARDRRKLEMAAGAIVFSLENPDESDPGNAAAVARLGALVEGAPGIAQVEREGVTRERTATAARRELRRTIIGSHVAHLAGVAELAAPEMPDARKWFVLGPSRRTFSGFLTAARLMLERAEGQRELLVRHGLSAKVLEDMKARLAEYEAATAEAREGRRAHIGARAALGAVAAEAFDVVKVLDGLNRIRFARDAQKLSEWEAVSRVESDPQRASDGEKAQEKAA